MLIDLLVFVVGLAGLLFSADFLVGGAIQISDRLNLSRMAVGLTVVAIGTSLPEAAASVVAALSGHPDIALGNVVGSNICNVALILGIPALFAPILCKPVYLHTDGNVMLGLSLVLWAVALLVGRISETVGWVFLGLFVIHIFYVLKFSPKDDSAPEIETDDSSLKSAVLKIGGSVVGIAVFSKLLVETSVELASALGVSESVIALSLVSLGTSLPELSVSLAAARKGEGDMLVGNIIGSNISNILLVTGLAAVIAPIVVDPQIANLDMPLMLITSVLMLFFLSDKDGINRPKATILLGIYGVVVFRFLTVH